MNHLTRRQALIMSAAVSAASLLNIPLAAAKSKDVDAAVAKFTGGAKAEEGNVSLTLPEIAENGSTVPFSVAVKSPMTGDDHVKRVIVLADGNPRPFVATFNFSANSGAAKASSRMRLAKTQNITAVAETSKGKFYMVKRQVKVTIGGCGG